MLEAGWTPGRVRPEGISKLKKNQLPHRASSPQPSGLFSAKEYGMELEITLDK
jgi:hypothetical protein